MSKSSGAKIIRTKGSQDARALSVLPAVVLHVDDDPNDTELLCAATRKAEVPFLLHNVEDGDQAIAYLKGQGAYANRERYRVPALILLDLKMPRATGFEILKWIRSHPEFGQIPVVVLSGSELQDDINHAHAVGANAYLIKPLGFNALVSLVKELYAVWLSGQPAVMAQAPGAAAVSH